MRRRLAGAGLWCLACCCLLGHDMAQAQAQLDPSSGLVVADDWELVRGHCTACHSARLITQQRGDAQRWLTMIRWMQKTQGLWQFDAITERRIIQYLASNYPPQQHQRRPPLRASEMPP